MQKGYENKQELIDKLNELAKNHNNVFRGYSTQNQMLPKIITNQATDREILLIDNFEKYASHYINAKNPIDLVAYAQHFGLSTRLLDFTYNPFIALYFALFDEKSQDVTCEDKDFYYISYANLEKQIYARSIPILNYWADLSIGDKSLSALYKKALRSLNDSVSKIKNTSIEENEKDSKNYFLEQIYYDLNIGQEKHDSEKEKEIESLKEKFKSNKLLFVETNQSNQRLIMQQGLFMFPYVLDEQNLSAIISENTTTIKIHKNLRSEMQQYLDTIGINTFRLMPDLSSICKAVERKVKEERKNLSHLVGDSQ